MPTTSTRSSESTSRSAHVVSIPASSAPGTLICASAERTCSRISFSFIVVLLSCTQRAIDGQGASVDVRRLLRAEEGDGGGHFVGPPHPAGRHLRQPPVRYIGGHAGLDQARRDRVAGHALAGHLTGDGTR